MQMGRLGVVAWLVRRGEHTVGLVWVRGHLVCGCFAREVVRRVTVPAEMTCGRLPLRTLSIEHAHARTQKTRARGQ